ncbi:MAG: CU044_2847 family protein [Bacteroidota bacterium]
METSIITFDLGDNGSTEEIHFEISPINTPSNQTTLTPVGTAKKFKKATMNFSNALNPIKSVAQTVVDKIKELPSPPNELTLEMGLKLTADTSAVIAKAGSEAHMKIVFKWNK